MGDTLPVARRPEGASDGGQEQASSPPRVFINYRREDASGHAGRLYDALANRFGREHVFMDVDAIRPGENFATVLDQNVESCDVFVALIGRRWTSSTDREGRRRLDRPEDYVRLELQTALDSPRIRVIPALVQDAEMPTSDELPETIRDLSMRQAIELDDARWRTDVERLFRALEGETSEPEAGPSYDASRRQRRRGDEPSRRRGWMVAAGVVALAAVAIVVGVITTRGSSPPPPPPPKPSPGNKQSTVRYARHSTSGYQALLPTGGHWSKPSDSQPVPGRLYRTSVRDDDGAFVIIDYTPREKPRFSDAYASKTTVGQTAFGSATKYVFQGGRFPECRSSTCIDYQVSIRSSPGGLAVLAGGPSLSKTRALARTVTQSLTAPSGG